MLDNFALEKGKNIQGVLAIGILLSLFMKWFDLVYIDGSELGVKAIYGIVIIKAFQIFLISLISIVLSVWIAFTQEPSKEKNKKIGILAIVIIIVNLIIRVFFILSKCEHSVSIGFYLALILCLAQVRIMYKDMKKNAKINI